MTYGWKINEYKINFSRGKSASLQIKVLLCAVTGKLTSHGVDLHKEHLLHEQSQTCIDTCNCLQHTVKEPN